MLGRLEYPGATYTHQGWWTERNWHQFVLLNDELDEVEGVVADGIPITHIIDLTDLRKPKWTGTFQSTDHKAVDHNLYITDGVMFQSNYGAGVWVTDVRSISKYPDGSRVKHIAFMDVHPEDDVSYCWFLLLLCYLMLTFWDRRLAEVSISSALGAISNFPRASLSLTRSSAELTA
jgi:choice-of-anchor B domain-containing protein